WINGTVVKIDASGGGGASAAFVTAPSSLQNGRLGVLVFASATLTQTMAGTAFGFAQVYGEAQARVQGTMSVPGVAMILASVAGQLIAATGQLGTGQADVKGITAIGTGSVNA